MISGMDLKNDERKVGIWPRECVFRNQRPRFGKENFFKVFFHKKLTGGPYDEILKIFVLCDFLWGRYFKKSEKKTR